MHHSSRLLIATLALIAAATIPAAALAQGFITARSIELPSLAKRTQAVITLDTDAMHQNLEAFLVINDANVAVPADVIADEINLMPKAVFDQAPEAANTVPKTELGALRDGDFSSYFQPVTGREHLLLFHFAEPVSPTSLLLDTTDASIESVHVRLGSKPGSLKDATEGSAVGRSITLSGEQGEYVEVRIRVSQGVLRIGELQLLASRKRVVFTALPQEQYRLLYGALPPIIVLPAYMRDNLTESITEGVLGGTEAFTQGQNDFDGIPDAKDSCPAAYNPEQYDEDQDGVGDACDNCLGLDNPRQDASVCADDDGDGVWNGRDNCPKRSNSAQADEDQDGVGNLCDTSDDRWSEQRPWLLWAGMAIVIVAITGLGGFVMMRSAKK